MQPIFRLTSLTLAAKSYEKLVNQKSCNTVLILDVLYSIIIFYFSFRYYDYSLQKAELFMMDFCYFVNFSVVLQTAFFPDNLLWFKANYVLCMGPICIAIMVWKNSLVFHSLDKLTSFFLHAFPTMVSILVKVIIGHFFTSYKRNFNKGNGFSLKYFFKNRSINFSVC